MQGKEEVKRVEKYCEKIFYDKVVTIKERNLDTWERTYVKKKRMLNIPFNSRDGMMPWFEHYLQAVRITMMQVIEEIKVKLKENNIDMSVSEDEL